jgi:micrococcal nuclease
MSLYQYKAHCTKVYDGDTITVNIDLGFHSWLFNMKIRLYGIDTPELRGDTIEAGRVARDYLRGLILDKDIILETHKDKTGKYGRWLGVIHLPHDNENTVSVNEILVHAGHAVRYML